jgi:small-conductance mechanosensitive channel
MEPMQQTTDVLSSLRTTWRQFVEILPRVAIAILLLLVGWVLAKVARRVAMRVARWLRVDTLAERAGFEDFLLQGGVQYTTVTLIGGVVYWTILFLTFVALLNVLAVPAAAALLERIVAFIPNVLVAVVVLIFGSVLARFVGSVTYTYLNNIGSQAANVIGALARYAMLVFVIAVAMEQLRLRADILVTGFQIAFGGLCLALALAFGLGGRNWAERILDRFWKG